MSAMISSISACIFRRTPTRSCTRWPASTIRSSAGAGRTKRGRSWKRSPRLAARTGFASAIVTLRFISSALVDCSGARVSSTITGDFCRRLGVGPRVLPATDDRLRTRLRTDEGWLDFQDYFVRLQCRPVVRELAFDGADHARAHPDLLAALGDERLRAVIICPSNPFISVEPILAVPGIRQALGRLRRARHRGFSDHWRTRGQGSDRQDDDGAWNDSERRRGRSSATAICSMAM